MKKSNKFVFELIYSFFSISQGKSSAVNSVAVIWLKMEVNYVKLCAQL